jgi:hypothetical protein
MVDTRRRGDLAMDFSDPGLLFSGFVISMIGLALFLHGKKMEKARNLCIGLAMMVFPIFVHSLLWMWVIAGACMAGVYLIPDGG